MIDTGPITFHLEGGPDPGTMPVVEFVYTNRVPPATIATRASDRADADQFVSADAAIDDVDFCGLVPGTEYRALGTIQVVASGSATPSGVAASATFVPTDSCGRTSVTFEIAEDSPLRGAVGVVFQTIVVAATGQVVAEHVDPSSAAQTLYFPHVRTVMRADQLSAQQGLADDRQTVPIGARVVDVVSYTGLAAGATYRAQLTLHERLDDGTCVDTDMTAVTEFTPTPDGGEVVVGPVTIARPGVFVGFERIVVVDGANAEAPAEAVVATHEDCDEISQTVRVIEPPPPPPAPSTAASTTPLPPPTSPSNSEVTTTAPPTSSPSVVMSTTTSSSTLAPPDGTLPRTGSNARSIAAAAALLASCGAGALALTRRRW